MTCLDDHYRAMARRLADRILEDESLTADLIDDAASALLDWGVAQAEAMAELAERLSQEELNAYLADLRHTIKHINKQAGEAMPEAQVERVQALLAEFETEEDLEAEDEA
jgi:glycine cleavage system pyridoxal-binding protein P